MTFVCAKDFKVDLHQRQDMLSCTASIGERVRQTTASRGQDVIQREMQSLQDDWVSFSTAVADVENNLESCIANWLQLDDEHSKFVSWMDRMDAQIKSFMEPRPNLIRKRQHLQEGEVKLQCLHFPPFSYSLVILLVFLKANCSKTLKIIL